MKRKSIPDGEGPFGAKKVKVENEQNGVVSQEEKKIKRPKVKKTTGQQNGTGGKKGKQKSDVANEEENWDAKEGARRAPPHKVAEHFRQKLIKGAVAVDSKPIDPVL